MQCGEASPNTSILQKLYIMLNHNQNIIPKLWQKMHKMSLFPTCVFCTSRQEPHEAGSIQFDFSLALLCECHFITFIQKDSHGAQTTTFLASSGWGLRPPTLSDHLPRPSRSHSLLLNSYIKRAKHWKRHIYKSETIEKEIQWDFKWISFCCTQWVESSSSQCIAFALWC